MKSVIIGVLLFLQAISSQCAYAFTVGNPKAAITVVSFFDYACPHCQHMEQALNNDPLLQASSLRVVYRPVAVFTAASRTAALAVLAADYQHKAQQLHQLLIQSNALASPTDLRRLARKAGLNTAQLERDMNAPATHKELARNQVLLLSTGSSGLPALVMSRSDGHSPVLSHVGEVSVLELKALMQKLQQVSV